MDDGVVLGYARERDDEMGLELGPGAWLRSGTIVYSGSSIGRRFRTGHHVVIREDTSIGDDVSVWSNSIVDYGCVIGDRVKIHANCYVAQYTEICDDAFLAPGVCVANDLFPGNATSAAAMRGPWIGPGAQLGVNVTVVPFVSIGAGAIIGAGAVVTRDIPDGVLAYGNPAVVVKRVDEIDIEERVRDRASRADRGGSRSAIRTRAPGDLPR
ncbi:MAG TPA: DapH/DapD/GlmU-related protein [Actinomycetota bacterium]|nr:DapH/DapD/GlmU-related protein [Actinomycetota bacterium]